MKKLANIGYYDKQIDPITDMKKLANIGYYQ